MSFLRAGSIKKVYIIWLPVKKQLFSFLWGVGVPYAKLKLIIWKCQKVSSGLFLAGGFICVLVFSYGINWWLVGMDACLQADFSELFA